MIIRVTFKRVSGRIYLEDSLTGHGMIWYSKDDFVDFVKGDGGNKYEKAFRECVREIIAKYPEVKSGDFTKVNVSNLEFDYQPAKANVTWP